MPFTAPATAAPPVRRAPDARTTAALRRPPVWICLLVAAIVLVPATWVFLGSGATDLPRVERYPGTAPAEWGPGATWASPPLLPRTTPTVVGDDDVALVTAERRLLLVEAADGVVRWEVPLPDGEVSTPPTLTRIDGEDVLAAHIGDRFTWWSVHDGSSDHVEVPPDGVVSTLGEVPLIAAGGTDVLVMASSRPARVQVPKGAIALAAHEDGTVTATSPTGWWHLAPDGSIESSGAWENPSSAPTTVAGYLSGFVLLVRGGTPTTLEIHADRTTDVRYVVSHPVALPGGTGGQLAWRPSPSGSWGILGRTLIDLRSATVTDLGAWSTRTVTADRAYGHIDGQTVVVGPGIPRGVIAPGEAVPDALTVSGALVRGPAPEAEGATTGGSDPRRPHDVTYLLPPRRTS